MRSIVPLFLVVLASGPASVPTAPAADPAAGSETSAEARPPRFERLRYNARERTDRAVSLLEAEEFSEAAASLETARRLSPESPDTLYNVGTGHLHALDSRAVAELEEALEVAPPSLRADAAYNLGNARYAANDFQGAVDAYKESLRADSTSLDTKFNLELALEKLEEQQQQQQQSDSPSDSDSEGGESDSGDQQSPPSDDQEQDESSGEGDQENEQQQGEPDPQEGEGENERNPLPQFQEQPEMTAEQAAAILEAVDNLERQQRQEDAQDQARPVPSGGKDW